MSNPDDSFSVRAFIEQIRPGVEELMSGLTPDQQLDMTAYLLKWGPETKQRMADLIETWPTGE